MSKLNDDLLDQLMNNIGRHTVNAADEVLKDLSHKERIEYVCRAYTEILSVLIVAAPRNEVEKVCNQICKFLQSSVARNISMTESFGFSLTADSIETLFKDTQIFLAKEAKA